MKILLTILLMSTICFGQNDKYNSYSNYLTDDQTTAVDSILTLQITNSVDYLATSIRATGSADLPLQIDSTYWLINQEDVAVTWANADQILKSNGWQSIDTLLHGLSANGYVRIGLACLDTAGDTTAIAQRRHYVNVFDETGPTILTYTATGVQYDSVQHVGTFTAETGAFYGLFKTQDTTDTNLLTDWVALADFDTTLAYNVTGETNQTFYLAAKDSLNNVSWDSDAAIIEDTPVAPVAGTFNYILNTLLR